MSEENYRYATPSDCLKIIQDIETSLLDRARDRALIDVQFNGGRPFTPEEEKEHQIQVNANFLEGYKIAQSGILQMNGALLYKERFCDVRCVQGRVIKRDEWGAKLTRNLHRALKRGSSGKKFNFVMQNRNASLVLHGIGALWWATDYKWMPQFVALDDLLIPTDTPLDFSEELGYFGINSYITAWQLYQMTQGPKVDPGWDRPYAMAILKSLLTAKNYNFTPDYFEHPEKCESLWKQRSTFLNSDTIPKIKITNFYHQDSTNGSWYRKVIVRENQAQKIDAISTDKFLYEGKRAFAQDIDEIIHIQYGDGSVVAPFKFRSVRGLGVLLYSVIELMNRLRCQFTQHVFQNLIPLLRIDNPADQDRPRMLQMQSYGVVEPGVNFVKQEDRHQIDPRLVQESMSEFRQLMSENSASYVQDIDTGSAKPMTLGEAQIRLQSVNKLVASMLMGGYVLEGFFFEEVLRRFFNKTSTDKDVKRFQEACRRDKIPEALMVPEAWEVDIIKVYGSGDQTLAQQEVSALMSINPQLDPTSQRKVRRDYISVFTRNPEKAADLVPEQPEQVTDGRKAAEDVFGTLMCGVEVGLREGIEARDYCASMLASMESVIKGIESTDNVGTPQDVRGLATVAQDVEKHLAVMESDPDEKEFVTAAQKELGAMMNLVKAFAERQDEAAKKNQMDPEAMAKIQTDQMAAQQKMQINEATAQQKLEQKQQAFEQKMNQDMQKHTLQMQQMMSDAQAKIAQAQADAEAEAVKSASEMAVLNAKADAEMKAMVKMVEIEIATMKAKADAEIANAKKKSEAAPATPDSD